jgi:hypothetical protein
VRNQEDVSVKYELVADMGLCFRNDESLILDALRAKSLGRIFAPFELFSNQIQ